MSQALQVPVYRLPMVWLKRLYDWTLGWADTPYGTPALFALAFMEASFFPIPPDVLLMALCLSRPGRAFFYAFVSTLGSVAGAALGWTIGHLLWRSMGLHTGCPQFQGGAWLFDMVPGFSCERFATVQALYEGNAWWAIFVSAFTPIPFKVFTIAAGVFQIALATLLLASLVGRAGRFFMVAGLIWRFGPPIKRFIERRFEWLTLLFTVLLVGGFLLIEYAM